MNNLKSKKIISKIVKDKIIKLLDREVIYHPLLHKTFTHNELHSIFKRDIKNEVALIEQLIFIFLKKKLKSRRKIYKYLKWLYSNHCNGTYFCGLEIEISCDVYENIVEIFDHNQGKEISKDKFFNIFNQNNSDIEIIDNFIFKFGNEFKYDDFRKKMQELKDRGVNLQACGKNGNMLFRITSFM